MTTEEKKTKTTTTKPNKSTNHKATPRTKKKVHTYQTIYLVLGLIISFFSVITVFNLGFFGLVAANFFRLLVGEAYTLLVPVIFIYGLRMIATGKLPVITFKPLLGGLLIMCAITTLLHFNVFYETGATAQTIFNETFLIFRNELLTSQNYQNLGGGMLGALFYASFGYLFSYWGTYLLVFLLFFSGLFLVTDIGISDFLESVSYLGKSLVRGVQLLGKSLKNMGAVFKQVNVSHEDKQYVPAIQKKKRSANSYDFSDEEVEAEDHQTVEPIKEKQSPKLLEQLFKRPSNRSRNKNQSRQVPMNPTLEPTYQPSIEKKTRREWTPYTPADAVASTAAMTRESLEERQVLDLDYFDEINATNSRPVSNPVETKAQSVVIASHEAAAQQQAEPVRPSLKAQETSVEQTSSNEPTEVVLPVDAIPENENVSSAVSLAASNMSQAATHWQEGVSHRQALTGDQLDEILESGEAATVSPRPAVKKSSKTKAYRLPGKNLLNKIPPVDQSEEYDRINENIIKLERTFESFGVKATVKKANLGPSVTKYEIEPAIGVKVSKIVSLSDDIALALAARDIRMEAPIPGKSLIGIEVPNNQVSPVSFNEIIDAALESDDLLEVPLGRDISGSVCLADLSKMPHLLIAGATGSGKSVGMNVIIVSLLMKAKPEEVKFLMIDPKKVELTMYDGIPHLLSPVVTNPRKAAQALNKVVQEMERRYELFAATGVRNVDSYNEQIESYNLEESTGYERLPKIVVFVDELADLMMVASNDVEHAIIRLAQMARAAGIHMIIATQRPSVDVITGIIKANVPSRLAFAVSSGIDSRTILDSNGAEKLLGRGDMLFQPMGKNKPIRVQGAYISDAEVEKITGFIKDQRDVEYDESMMVKDEEPGVEQVSEDEYFEDTIELIRDQETVSISQLQRKYRIGYNRAARLIDDLESIGYVSEQDGSKPRQVLIGEQNLEL